MALQRMTTTGRRVSVVTGGLGVEDFLQTFLTRVFFQASETEFPCNCWGPVKFLFTIAPEIPAGWIMLFYEARWFFAWWMMSHSPLGGFFDDGRRTCKASEHDVPVRKLRVFERELWFCG
jgi:hypothetical protein